jgi:hypothetical protein
MHIHLRGDQWNPRMQRAFSTHCRGGAQACWVQTPSGGVQIPQLSLQQTSPLVQALGPHGTVFAGQRTTQWCGQTCLDGQCVQTVRQPSRRAARDMRVPSISAEPPSVDPQATTWAANTNSTAPNSARAFTVPSSRGFVVSYYYSEGERNNFC